MNFKRGIYLMLVTICISILTPLLVFGCATPAAPDPAPSTSEPTPVTPDPAPVAPDPTPNAPGSETKPGAGRVDVVYFHRTKRCYSCTYAEEQTRYTLETYFINELESGKITFKSIDIQDEGNSAIIEKYGAYTSQLFINTAINGTEHIEHVVEIWQAIGDNDAFSFIVRDKVRTALEEID